MNRQWEFSRNAAKFVLYAALACLQFIAGTRKLSASDRVAISDTKNNRVLIFDAPWHTNESASVVLGQADFLHGSPNRGGKPAANTLRMPMGLAKDSDGNLYVADLGNCRILQFRPPFTNGMSASQIIKDPGFASASCDSDSMSFPLQTRGLVVPISLIGGASGNLFAVDMLSSRVLQYQSLSTKPNLVLGESKAEPEDYASNCEFRDEVTAETLCAPLGIAFDAEGNLWVADAGDNRVLKFEPPFSPSMRATLELGQPAETAFTSNSYRSAECGRSSAQDDPNSDEIESICPSGPESPTGKSLYSPRSLAFDGHGNLWVADQNNGRILEYVAPFSNGMTATIVIGEEDFRHRSLGGQHPQVVSANTLTAGTDLAFDSSGSLMVVDSLQHRVLVFNPPFRNGMPATLVLGSADFKNTNFNRDGRFLPRRAIAANLLNEPSDLVVF